MHIVMEVESVLLPSPYHWTRMQKKKLRPTDSIIDPRPINIYRMNAKSSVGLSREEFEQSSIRASRTPGRKGRLTFDELGRWAKRDVKGLLC